MYYKICIPIQLNNQGKTPSTIAILVKCLDLKAFSRLLVSCLLVTDTHTLFTIDYIYLDSNRTSCRKETNLLDATSMANYPVLFNFQTYNHKASKICVNLAYYFLRLKHSGCLEELGNLNFINPNRLSSFIRNWKFNKRQQLQSI